MTRAEELSDVAARVWNEVGGAADFLGVLTASGPRAVLPSHFDVTGLATASVAAATLAAAEFPAGRNDTRPAPVTVDSRQACAAFAAEARFSPVGWELPDIWDPIAGNYQARDGWIRLHTNYAYHRTAVERLLGAQRGGHPAERHFTILRIRGGGDLWVSECVITYDGAPTYSVSVMELSDDLVTHETQYFADPFPAPSSRAALAEPMPDRDR